jgi:hypothetical protein
MEVKAAVLGEPQQPRRNHEAEGHGDDEVHIPEWLSSQYMVFNYVDETHSPAGKCVQLMYPESQLLRRRLDGN